MTPKNIIKYWLDTAQEDWETAQAIYQAKHYSNALFFCHLAIEKLLKGLVYKNTDEPPPPIHNLLKLSQTAKISVSEQLMEQLKEISKWNLEARYDSYKREFYHKATLQYSKQWIDIAYEVFLWLKKQF